MKFTAFCPNPNCISHKFVVMQNGIVQCKKCQQLWYQKELKICSQFDEDEMNIMSKIKKEAK